MAYNKVSVRFAYQPDYKDKPYFQPLYYIGQNMRLNISKAFNDLENYNEEMRDQNMQFEDITHGDNNYKLEISQIITDKKKKTTNKKSNFSYIFNRFKNEYMFTYKEKYFTIKTEGGQSDNTLISLDRCENYEQYGWYEIKFNKEDFALFEEFIRESIKYYNKYFNEDLDKRNAHNYIKIYIGHHEGFFQKMGKRYKRSLETVYLPAKQKNTIVEDMTKFFKPETRERYMQLGINYKRTYLLEGIPGAGKSSLIMALASHFDYNLAIVSFHPKMTDNDLMHLLRSIDMEDEDRKAFIVFEDMDCIFKERKSHDDSKNLITFSGLLNALDGITTSDNQICFITTNYKHNLDSALIRPGRVDYIMKFDYASKEQINEIFKVYTQPADESLIAKFYTELAKFNIKISTSLLQQYLLKYLDDAENAIEKLEELKKMFDACNIAKEAEETGFYS